MNRWLKSAYLTALALLLVPGALHGQNLQMLTTIDPTQVPAGAGGDSCTPLLTPDGRFVVFASTARNLLLNSAGAPLPQRFPASLDIYLRDRLYQTNALVSLNTAGLAGGNGDSFPMAVSPDGRYVLFQSDASDLVAGDTNNAADIFIRDLAAGTTVLVSVGIDGAAGNGDSRSPAITPDGHFVAFVSAAGNLVPGDTNRIADVFVRDLISGATVLASVGATSAVPNACSSEAPVITADGRFVAFYSTASNLVDVVTGFSDIYIRDLFSNITVQASSYAHVAIPSNNVVCFNHVFSADGRFLAYEAAAAITASAGTVFRYNIGSGTTDVVATNATVPRGPFDSLHSLDINADGSFIAFVANYNATNSSATCVRRWDAQSGDSVLVSGDPGDEGILTNSICFSPALDAAGRYVAFLSTTNGAPSTLTNLVPTDEFHIYLHDTQSGSRVLIDAGPNGAPSNSSPATGPRLSPDGRFVAFEVPVWELASNALSAEFNVFFKDLQTGVVELISAHDPTLPTSTPNGRSSITQTSISADGRYVAFASEADNLVSGDTNRFSDVFVRDLATGITRLVSVSTNGASGDGFSGEPSISADGRFIAFTSAMYKRVEGGVRRSRDVFIRDLQAGTTTLVSVNASGTAPGWGPAYSPTLSSDARFVLFRSTAIDLAPGFLSSWSENLFIRDLQARTNYALTLQAGAGIPQYPIRPGGLATAAMTPDARLVAVADQPGALAGKFYIWDSLAATWIYTNVSVGTIMLVAISPDGNRLAYWVGSAQPQLYVADRRSGAKWALTQGTVRTASAELRFSGNSQVLAYNYGSASGPSQVYCYDFQTGTSLLVSTAYGTGQPAAGASDSPAVSADGRFIAYRSAAENIVPGDLNGQPDIFVYDRQTGANTLLSTGNSALGGGDSRSLKPVFSGDGSRLVFETWASDLAPRDFNHNRDLLAYTFLTLVLLPGSDSNPHPVLSWPLTPGSGYTVQYKDSLGEAAWQDLAGSVTNSGMKAFLEDASPSPAHRVYRVKSF
ncbi:MAG TPA: hypothetical protein VJA21_29875 [Verrucomicrobiae bacterium]